MWCFYKYYCKMSMSKYYEDFSYIIVTHILNKYQDEEHC